MRLVLALAAALITSPVMADSPLEGQDDTLATVFNAQAKKLDLDQRLALSSCESGKVEVCTYSGGSDIRVLATAVEGKKSINQLLVVFGSKSPEAIHLISTLGTLMAVYAPDAPADERGVVFSSLFDGLKSDDKKADAYLHGVKFSASAPEGMGVWIFISHE